MQSPAVDSVLDERQAPVRRRLYISFDGGLNSGVKLSHVPPLLGLARTMVMARPGRLPRTGYGPMHL